MEKEKKEQKRISLEEAIKQIRRHTTSLTAVRIPLKEIQGEVLCKDIMAMHDQPPFPRSPLDGYAVRGEETEGASKEHPVNLKVIDKFCAGEYRNVEVKTGECIRIMTGAPIPKGANAVIRQEDTDYGEDKVQLYRAVSPWENYCFQGEDYKKGDLLLPAGTILNFAAIAVLASNGISEVTVYPKPRVVVLATGDELMEPGTLLGKGKIYNSNIYMVKARLREWGIESRIFHVEDKKEIVKQKIIEGMTEADAVITTGGVSVGEKDILNEVLMEPEIELLFGGLNLKPGSPAKYALYKGKPILALSGNPFAALATLELLGKPMLDCLMHVDEKKHKRTTAVLENAFLKASKVRRLIRGTFENGRVRIPEGHSSGQLCSMLGCNCLVDIPKGTEELPVGSIVEIIML